MRNKDIVLDTISSSDQPLDWRQVVAELKKRGYRIKGVETILSRLYRDGYLEVHEPRGTLKDRKRRSVRYSAVIGPVKPLHLTPDTVHVDVLRAVSKAPGSTGKALRNTLGRTNVSSALFDLYRRGEVRRSSQRPYVYWLTEQGSAELAFQDAPEETLAAHPVQPSPQLAPPQPSTLEKSMEEMEPAIDMLTEEVQRVVREHISGAIGERNEVRRLRDLLEQAEARIKDLEGQLSRFKSVYESAFGGES